MKFYQRKEIKDIVAYLKLIVNTKQGIKGYVAHRLVAKYFLEDYDEGLEVDHINDIRDDNRVEFLINLSTEEDNTYFNVIDDTEQYESRIVNNLSMSKLNPYNTKSWVESNATTKSIFHIASEIIRLT